MILSADTSLFLYAADYDSPYHEDARRLFEEEAVGRERFLLCDLVLVELYMQLRNRAVLKPPQTAREASLPSAMPSARISLGYSVTANLMSPPPWYWSAKTNTSFSYVIDALLVFTLHHHGVTHSAMASAKHFDGMGFQNVWNPLSL